MKKRNKFGKTFLLIILLLGVSIGFAALTTTLKINGTATINKNTWDVHWANVGNIQKSSAVTETVVATVDQNDTTKVNFTVALNEPGDFYEFQVDAVNAGTLNAMVNLVSTIVNNDETASLPSYLKLSIKYADDTDVAQYHLLAKADNSTTPATPTVERLKIRLEYDRDIDEATMEAIEDNTAIGIEINIPYKQADENAIDIHLPAAENYESDSWDIIAAAGSEAATQKNITNGKCGPYHLGDTRVIELDMDGDNTPEQYVTRIANCSTPDICTTSGFSQTACGFVIEFQDIIGSRYYNPDMSRGGSNGTGSKGSWEYSDIRAYLNNGIHSASSSNYSTTGVLGKIPQEIRNHIINTFVVTGHGTMDNSNFETTDKLYIPSMIEIWEDNYSNWDTAYDKSRQLDYYKWAGINGNSCEGAGKSTNGITEWWTRTVRGDADGKWVIAGPCAAGSSAERGISPAFRLG